MVKPDEVTIDPRQASETDWVTMNPDIMVKPSSALVSKPSTRGVFKGLTIMSEFFLGACMCQPPRHCPVDNFW